MTPLTVESLVELVDGLAVGESLPYHQGYIAAEQEKHENKIRFNRLITAIDVFREMGYVEVYQTRITSMTYKYFIRRRAEWPKAVVMEIAKELDTKVRINGWFIEAMKGKLNHADE